MTDEGKQVKSNIIIREVFDFGEVVEIIESYNELEYVHFKGGKEEISSFAKKQLEYGHVLVAFQNDEVVGYLCFYCNDMESRTAFISAIVVGGEGLVKGRVFFGLTEAAVKIGVKAGMTSLRIGVDKDNTYARKVYEKMGFKYTGEENGNDIFMLISKEQLISVMKIRIEE